MKTIRIIIGQPHTSGIPIGRRGENKATEIVFDIRSLAKTYGSGSAALLMKRPEEDLSYPIAVTQDGSTVTWVVTNTDTAICGEGRCQLLYYVDDVLAKTVVYKVIIEDDIGDAADEAPDAYDSLIEDLAALVAETAGNALSAAESAEAASTSADKAEAAVEHYPTIIDDEWNIWDAESEAFAPTGVQAVGPQGEQGEQGETGNGIASAVLNDDYTLTIAFTDGTEYTTPSIRGEQGIQGEQGEQGVQGEPGEKGDPGDAYVLTPQDKSDIADIIFSELPSAPVQHYGARWNKVTAQMERTGSTVNITTNTTHFRHAGSVDPDYYNPFDNIYPWAGCRLCNIDLDMYRELTAGDDITDCIVAWDGDPDFSYAHPDGVWKYRPEFWGKTWDEGDYRYFDITDKAVGGYVHYPAEILARWHGVVTRREFNGNTKSILLPIQGMPYSGMSLQSIHSYAKNGGMTLDSVFSLDGSLLMMVIEYATFDMQEAIGLGVTSLYRQSASDKFTSSSSASNVVHISSENIDMVIPGAIMDIGTVAGGSQIGRFRVVSTAPGGAAGTITDVTLDNPVSVTTNNFWSIQGLTNMADSDIGSASGYIGENGRSNCYYRGEVLWGNMFYYVLGAYHQGGTNHVWLAKNDSEADSYDALDTSDHVDTGVSLASTTGFIRSLDYLRTSTSLACPALCSAAGGTSSNPVGDSFYVNPTSDTVLVVGGISSSGRSAGPFYWNWGYTSVYSSSMYSARPRLKHL